MTGVRRFVLDERRIALKRLGRHVNHDPRSRAYRVVGDSTPTTTLWSRQIPVLNQLNLGSCTGNAGVGALATGLNWVPLAALDLGSFTLDEAGAVRLYSEATKLDDAPGDYPPDDTGSDGLSVAKALKAAGLISGYQHAFGLADAFAAIQLGPLIVGTNWYSGMDHPDGSGLVHVTGYVRGGHEYECVGYDAASDLWHFVNSWGAEWGANGHFFYSSADFDILLRQMGDVVLFTPASQPAPVPTPTPSPGPAGPIPYGFDDAARVLDPWALKNHRMHAAQAWQAYAAAVRQ